MKKNRLIYVIVTILLVCFIFTACGSKTNTTNNNGLTTENKNSSENIVDKPVDTSNKNYINSKESFVEKISDLVDLSQYEDLDQSEVGNSVLYFYNMNSEKETTINFDYSIQLGDGSEFVMPITLNELEVKGWKLHYSSDPNFELKSGYSTTDLIENKDGKQLYVDLFNPNEETIALKDATVVAIESEQFSTSYHEEKMDQAIEFKVCDSITNTSTLEDIISVLGNPNEIVCTIVNNDNGYDHCKIEISYNGSSAYSNIEFNLSGDGNYILNMSYDYDIKAFYN
ncbi:MAG: hypothetical protein E7538_01670 [Ruminococcaceae bacterium]|nr:hypothetical protein [Oscillospiraceae bacterium]